MRPFHLFLGGVLSLMHISTSFPSDFKVLPSEPLLVVASFRVNTAASLTPITLRQVSEASLSRTEGDRRRRRTMKKRKQNVRTRRNWNFKTLVDLRSESYTFLHIITLSLKECRPSSLHLSALLRRPLPYEELETPGPGQSARRGNTPSSSRILPTKIGPKLLDDSMISYVCTRPLHRLTTKRISLLSFFSAFA